MSGVDLFSSRKFCHGFILIIQDRRPVFLERCDSGSTILCLPRYTSRNISNCIQCNEGLIVIGTCVGWERHPIFWYHTPKRQTSCARPLDLGTNLLSPVAKVTPSHRSSLQPNNSSGLQLQPTIAMASGLQPNSDGLEPNSFLSLTWYVIFFFPSLCAYRTRFNQHLNVALRYEIESPSSWKLTSHGIPDS